MKKIDELDHYDQRIIMHRLKHHIREVVQVKVNTRMFGEGDDGVTELLTTLRVWMDGLEGRVPAIIKPYLEHVKQEFDQERLLEDAEFNEYKRLHQKFHGTLD